MENNKPSITLPYSGSIYALDISPDGRMLAIGQQADFYSTNPILTLWSLPQRQLIAEIEHMSEKSIDAVCFSGDSKFLYYVKNHEYPEVLVYNLENQNHLKPDQFKAANVTWLACAKQAPRLVTAGLITEVWNTETWERSLSLLDYIVLGGERRKAAVADLTPDGKKIAVVGKNIDQVHIYDIEQNVIIQTLDEAPRQASWVRYSPDLRYLAAIDDSGGKLCLWYLETGHRHLVEGFSIGGDKFEFDGFLSLSFHPSSKYLGLANWTGIVRIIRLSDAEQIASLKAHEGRVYGLTFTPDGKQLISGDEYGTVSFWELEGLLET
ncbi:MAG TPA: hypothetical protein DCY88_30200 [Cyanobacteria bacterium UBA11372]|nr:hypothetical protein [Cyanobacteria bacterium UBA11372]